MTTATDAQLDQILALQFTVAWAGEGRSKPSRLGWWDTDLVDEAGGGDLFLRLAPKTHAWAALESVREAARRVDAAARKKMADPDGMRTLFFLGFELDEALGDRLATLKRTDKAPAASLALPIAFDAAFSAPKLEKALIGDGGSPPFAIVPGGRQLKGVVPAEPDAMVKKLASALVPLADSYPLPFYKLKA